MHMRMDFADSPSGAVFPQAFHYYADIMDDKIPLLPLYQRGLGGWKRLA
jgi:hypothetical protein